MSADAGAGGGAGSGAEGAGSRSSRGAPTGHGSGSSGDRPHGSEAASVPRFSRALLGWVLSSEDRPFVLGDLEEEYETVLGRSGLRAARRWARSQALRSIVPSLWRRLFTAPPRSPDGLRRRGISPWVGRTVRELRTAARVVLRSPGYALTVILTFALAIGANVAVFSVVNRILLRPLPYAEPYELVMVHRVTDYGDEGSASLPDFRDWQREAGSFADYAAYTGVSATYLGGESAEYWEGAQSTLELFRVLGVPPLHGRTYSADIDDPEASDVLVLGHALWQRQFGGDPDAVGRTIRLAGGRSKTIIGVMPPGFYFPEPDAEYWTPLEANQWLDNRGAWFLRSIGRLAPGVTLAQAQSELSAIVARVDLAHASGEGGTAGQVRLEKRHEAYVGSTRALFAILLGAVGLVLAIACANIASLGLTRATAREREFAVRSALGAGRAVLVRQLLGENVILSLLGAAAGVAVSILVVNGLITIGPEEIPRLDEVAVDGTALGFALVVSIACGILFGIAPALRGSRSRLVTGLREGSRGSEGPAHRRTLQSLVISQIALAVVLVVGAGLLLNSFLRLSAQRPGFDTDRVLTVEVSLPADRYGEEQVETFYREIQRRTTALPSIDAFGYTSHLPLSGSDLQATYVLEGEVDHAEGREPVGFEVIGEDYLRAIGLPLLAGRPLAADDRSGSPQVALVNEEFVRRNWPGETPLGKRFTLDGELGEEQWHTVVGVVADVRKEGLDEERRPVAYYSRGQFYDLFGLVSGRHGYMTFRTVGDPVAAIGEIRREVAAVDPQLPLIDVRTTGQLVASSLAEARFRTLLIGGFAILALLVALVGIYGVMAFVVTRRTREIGIRMALGASSLRILGDVVRRGAWWIGIGLAVGLLGGLAATRVLAAMLYGVTASDPLTYAGVAIGLTVVALGACYLPARRAAALDPLDALREQ